MDEAEQVTIVPNLLDASRADRVQTLLDPASALWAKRTASSSAARGEVLQLASRGLHDTPQMAELRDIMLVATWGPAQPLLAGAQPESITPQVFPVMMSGNLERPPHQIPHRDTFGAGRTGAHPLVTMVYHFRADDVAGGELLVVDRLSPDYRILQSIPPRENQLVVLSGLQPHAVAPLTRGLRGSVVVNLYGADAVS